ncbi:MAG: linear amide C-N hydrolase [Roseibium album]|uniref:linear amide C-N hydrolase n=1 Tax=Roseibium album TaxID=311410 RepID=UPI0018CBCA5E|nr:choloylglycine hydrolase [Labrenzia sp. EL_132]MBG6227060.1 choloylglycine hydrolase [Labrenzia sp. EL_208]
MPKITKIACAALVAASLTFSSASSACTTIVLTAEDGAHVWGRTLEWGAFDINSEVMIVPRGQEFVSDLGEGREGFTWTARYGGVALNGFDQDYWIDGMNEVGLMVGANYHPGTAEYLEVEEETLETSIAAIDMMTYIATSFATVDEVREGITGLRAVGVIEPTLGFAAPLHIMVSDTTGETIVIEFLEGETVIFEAPLRVMTNSPAYDFHMTNLRNYINLSPVALPTLEIEDLEFAPLGAGSGMIGLPGDNTPVSRFVRAVAATQTARPTATGEETVYEIFRILDNFNLPLGAAEGDTLGEGEDNMRSATLWTSAMDSQNLRFYYHTMHNRRVRMLDLNEIDFDALDTLTKLPLDRVDEQDIEEITLN